MDHPIDDDVRDLLVETLTDIAHAWQVTDAALIGQVANDALAALHGAAPSTPAPAAPAADPLTAPPATAGSPTADDDLTGILTVIDMDAAPTIDAAKRRVRYVRDWADERTIDPQVLRATVEHHDANGYDQFTSDKAAAVIRDLAASQTAATLT